jgi:hypothetical protein
MTGRGDNNGVEMRCAALLFSVLIARDAQDCQMHVVMQVTSVELGCCVSARRGFEKMGGSLNIWRTRKRKR